MDYVFTWPVSFQYNRKSAPRVRKAAFGDGYVQRTKDGINNDPKSWDFIVQGTPDYLDGAEDFLKQRGGAEAFYWPAPRGGLIRVVCETWQRSDDTSADGKITGTFEQIFDGIAASGFFVTTTAFIL